MGKGDGGKEREREGGSEEGGGRVGKGDGGKERVREGGSGEGGGGWEREMAEKREGEGGREWRGRGEGGRERGEGGRGRWLEREGEGTSVIINFYHVHQNMVVCLFSPGCLFAFKKSHK